MRLTVPISKYPHLLTTATLLPLPTLIGCIGTAPINKTVDGESFNLNLLSVLAGSQKKNLDMEFEPGLSRKSQNGFVEILLNLESIRENPLSVDLFF